MNIFENNKITKLLFLLLLYFNTLCILNNPKLLKTIVKNTPKKKIFVKNKKKLYDSLKNPLLLIILNYENLNLKEKNISNLMPPFYNETFIDIFFVFIFPKNNKKKFIQNFPSNVKNVKIYIAIFKKWILNVFDIINKINSKYVIIYDKFLNLTKYDIFRIYNNLKGNKDNIIKCNINYKYYAYIIRTKILRDILDYNIEFTNIHELINYLYYYPLPKFSYIPISFSTDNKYISLCYTSMLSVLDSKGIFSYIIFYIIIPKDFEKQNIRFLESLYEQYDYFNITFLTMDNRWDNAFTSGYLTIHTYFRYSLAELIPNLDKIIYLDADIICLTDLSDFYNLNFNGKAILGRVLKINKIKNETYYTINAGVLLLNLKEMRNMKMEKKLLNIMKNGFGHKNLTKEKCYNQWTSLIMPGQAILNLYFYKYIGAFPPKFNAKNNFNHNYINAMRKNLGELYDHDYIYFSFKYPSIKHYTGNKKNLQFHDDWSYFARKSKYFNEISGNLSNIYIYKFNYF